MASEPLDSAAVAAAVAAMGDEPGDHAVARVAIRAYLDYLDAVQVSWSSSGRHPMASGEERQQRARRMIRETAEVFAEPTDMTPEEVDELDRDLWDLLQDHLRRVREAPDGEDDR